MYGGPGLELIPGLRIESVVIDVKVGTFIVPSKRSVAVRKTSVVDRDRTCSHTLTCQDVTNTMDRVGCGMVRNIRFLLPFLFL